MSSGSIVSPSARCPRCGYPLRGTLDSWVTSCPLVHPCSECSYEIDLGEVHAAPDAPDWFVGTATSGAGWCRRAPGSLVRMMVPFWPWRHLGLASLDRTMGVRDLFAWSGLVGGALVAVVLLALMSVEGWNIVHEVEARIGVREMERDAIARHEASVEAGERASQADDPRLALALEAFGRASAVPVGAAGSSLDRIRAMTTGNDVPRAKVLMLSADRDGGLSVVQRTVLPWQYTIIGPRSLGDVFNPRWGIIMLPLLGSMAAMSGLGLTVSRSFKKAGISPWIQFRLAVLSSSILVPVLLFVAVRIALAPEVRTGWSVNGYWLGTIIYAAGGGTLLLQAWWWGAFRMLEARFAFLMAFMMVILFSILTFFLAPAVGLLFAVRFY